MLRALLIALAALIALPSAAQNFPALSGRVVDQANLLSPEQEAELARRLEALERQNGRQLVVATVADLEGYDIADYGYQLGRHWRIGQGEANNGVLLLVAPNEKKVRIEVGYGLEGIVTDALAWQIVRDTILPRFRAGDMPGGIIAGADSLIQQLQAPPEAAEQRALEAAAARQREQASDGGGDSIWPMLIAMFVIFFVVLPAVGVGVGRGRHYRRRGGGLGPVILWGLASGMSGGGRSWGGGGGGFGGGGFSGGGGSFGGGGASGGW
ncbi:TPM domain-containing protein [Sphingosinicella sp. YJ22]|uniref:TPM domain-containing protein n=1 Tax=Sphingosinicella sp. YJ22 TaxID=1104780 RepID=UPI00140A0639|nr:TPM domain-containing protein [Sphingosinicella sp. YJ22]